MKRSFCFFALLSLGFACAAQADPVAELGKISDFKNVDLAKLANGEVLASHGPQVSLQRGLTVEIAYVVKASVARTLTLHSQWSPTNHPELKVYLHGDLSGRIDPAVFERKLASAPKNSAVKRLIAATEQLPGDSKLYLSSDEIKAFSKANGGGAVGPFPANVAAFWSALLSHRANAFAHGGLASQPAYALRGETVRAASDAESLLNETPQIRARFSSLTASAMHGGHGAQYWELTNVEGSGALSLGSFFQKQTSDGAQALDAHYYSSAGYYVLLSYYQMWPVQIGGRTATLVWRVDLLSSPYIANLHGIERLGSGTAMMREIQKSTRIFLKDISR